MWLLVYITYLTLEPKYYSGHRREMIIWLIIPARVLFVNPMASACDHLTQVTITLYTITYLVDFVYNDLFRCPYCAHHIENDAFLQGIKTR